MTCMIPRVNLGVGEIGFMFCDSMTVPSNRLIY